MLQVPLGQTTINALVWAPGHPQPEDVIAAACEDGSIRLIEVSVQRKLSQDESSARTRFESLTLRRGSSSSQQTVRSGIGAGLAGMSGSKVQSDKAKDGEVVHEVKSIASLVADHNASVRRLQWTMDGTRFA